MITRSNAKTPLTLLVAFTLLALALTIAATVLVVINSYLGFGLKTNPIACSSTQTYFTTKYNHNNYLATIDIAMVIVLLTELTLLVAAIVLRVKVGASNDQEQTFQSWTPKIQSLLFLLISLPSIFLILPVGYFLSFIREVSSNCSSSLLTQWILIETFTAIALILHLVMAVIVFRVRTHFQEEQEQQEQDKENQNKPLVEELSKKNNQPTSERKISKDQEGKQHGEGHQQERGDRFSSPLNDQKREQSSHLKENYLPPQDYNMKAPLLSEQEPSSKLLHRSKPSQQLQKQSQRLRLLRRQIQQEEERYNELRKSRKREQKKQEKGSNQTIINIHLTGGTNGSNPSAVVQEEKQEKKVKKDQLQKKYGKYREPIYEESSEESEQRQLRFKNRQHTSQDPRRFYSRKDHPGESVDPHQEIKPNSFYQQQILTRHPSQNRASFRDKPKNLSLGVLPSLIVSPFASPQQPTQLLPTINPVEESRVQKIGGGEEKNQSFFKELKESKFKSNNDARGEGKQPQAPKKRKKGKNTSLEAYIQALNFNMAANRPDYQKNFQSNNNSEVSYNSVLSSIEKGHMPAERDYNQNRDEFRGVLPSTVKSLLSVTQKIQQKYKYPSK